MSKLLALFNPEGPSTVTNRRNDRSNVNVGSSDQEPLTAYEISSKVSTLNSRIQSHQEHTVFDYVTIQPGDGRTKARFLKYLQTLSSRLYKEPVKLEKVPILNLIERSNILRFADSLNQKDFKNLSDWITIYEIGIVFSPSQGFYQDRSSVIFSVRDNRFSRNQDIQTVKVSNNVQSKFVMGLSYAVHKENLGDVILVIENPVSAIKEGRFWGSVKIELSILQSDTAIQSAIIAPMGVVEMHSSALVKHKHNPTKLDLDISEANLSKLIKMRKQGFIRDLSQTTASLQKVESFGGSEAGSDEPEEESEEFNEENENQKEEEDLVDRNLRQARANSSSNIASNWIKKVQEQFPKSPIFGNTKKGVEKIDENSVLETKKEDVPKSIQEVNDRIENSVGDIIVLKEEEDNSFSLKKIETEKEEGSEGKKIEEREKEGTKKVSFAESKKAGKQKEEAREVFEMTFKEKLLEKGIPKSSLTNYAETSPLSVVLSPIVGDLIHIKNNELTLSEFAGLKSLVSKLDQNSLSSSIFYYADDDTDFVNCVDIVPFNGGIEISFFEFCRSFFYTPFYMMAA